jgi:hypothetical protein
MTVHLYRMTIASTWYDVRAEYSREYELHFKVPLQGKPERVRRTLAKRGVPYFQQQIYRKYGKWVPKRRIRVSFEREEKARRVQRQISVNARTMRYRGKHHRATVLPSRVISYGKRKRKASKRRRA